VATSQRRRSPVGSHSEPVARQRGTFSDRTAALVARITGGYALSISTVMHDTGAADTIALNSVLDWLSWRSTGNGAYNLTGTPGQGMQI
jgi:hypothetical protein